MIRAGSPAGHLDDGGDEFELAWGGLIAVRDGVITRYELFDEDDEAGMLAAVARVREANQGRTPLEVPDCRYRPPRGGSVRIVHDHKLTQLPLDEWGGAQKS